MPRIILYPSIVLVAAQTAGAQNTDSSQWQPHNPVVFARPFPVVEQIYAPPGAPRQLPTPATPQGWQGQQLEFRFAKPFPVSSQVWVTIGQTRTIPTPATPYGWWGVQYSHQFAKPFPVSEQLFTVWDLVGDVPPFLPPGSGKRKDFPSYIPQPAQDAKPNKPFRPVWDKPRQGTVEKTAGKPAGPPPLPPAELFGTPGQAGDAKINAPPPLKLPSFDQYGVDNAEAFGDRMRQSQDMSAALAVLKKLGLLPGGDG